MGWLTDLLLEAPLPPGLWLPAPTRRHAQARAVLNRLRPGQPGPPSQRAYRTHDHIPLLPWVSMGRYVPAGEVEADLAESLTRLNPPVLQGWASILGVIALVVVVLTMPGWARPTDPAALLGLLGPPSIWVGVVLAAARLEKTVALDAAGTVRVRRWTDAWLRRPGVVLGDATTLRVALGPRTLTLTSESGATARIDLGLWPPSVRATLADDLHGWGVGVAPVARRRRRHHGGRSMPARRPSSGAEGSPTAGSTGGSSASPS